VKNVIIKIVLQKSSLTRICSTAKTAPKTLLACKSQSSHWHTGEKHRRELCLHCKSRICTPSITACCNTQLLLPVNLQQCKAHCRPMCTVTFNLQTSDQQYLS